MRYTNHTSINKEVLIAPRSLVCTLCLAQCYSYKKKKLGSNENNCAVGCQWSPDGRYLMTSTVAPRLRVDNG